jgi:hypothetical protein
MSDRVLLYIIIGAFLFAIGIGIFTGWHIKPDKQCPVIKDTLYVKGDTILVPYPVEVIKWKERKPAVKENDSIYTQTFDSSFVSHKDTIRIEAGVEFNESAKTFSMDMEIKHKNYESFRIDTIKVNYIEMKEVDDPLWKYTTVVGLLLLILSLIFGG